MAPPHHPICPESAPRKVEEATVTDSYPAVAVVSTSSTLIERETSRNLEEMIFDATTDALTKAGLTIEDIDAIVLSGNDEVDGRVISIMASSGPSGSVGRDSTMIASAADHALVYAYLRIRAGQSRRVLTVGWAKPSEGVDPYHAELMEAEPYILRNVGMNHTVAAALQASVLANAPAPTAGVVAWPLTDKDLPKRGDAVYALVLAADGEFPAGTELAWVLDCGWATVTYELGERDLSDFEPLRLALAQLSKRGSTGDPASWPAVEIGADSEPAVQAVADLLGLPNTATVNASGGLADVISSPHVIGLGRMVAAIEAVSQPSGPQVAAGIGFHGFAGQGATVAVFSKKKGNKS